MARLPHDAALVLIDVQRGFDEPALGPRNNPGAEGNVARLLAAWRASGRPIYHIQHHSRAPGSPLRPDGAGVAFKEEATPLADEPVIIKGVNSAFIGTDLEARLRRAGIATLIVAGLTTDHCVSTTVRMAGNLGFTAYLVADATATFDRVGRDGGVIPARDVQAITLASLHGEFATVLDTDDVLSRL